MMDSTVESLDQAYQAFMAATAYVVEAYKTSGGAKTNTTDAALENLKQQYELLQVACDRAQQLVESTQQRIGLECCVDEATGGSSSTTAGQTVVGIPPISAVKLEKMNKEIRLLVADILQRVRGASNSNPATATTAPLSSPASAGAQPTPTATRASGRTRSIRILHDKPTNREGA